MSEDERRIVELLRDNPYGMSRSQLLQATDLPVESLNASLNRLESEGIVYHDVVSDTYKLKGILIPKIT